MPRITKELSRTRDQKAYTLFLEKDSEGHFTKTVKEVNDQLEVDDGFRMGLARIYQLHDAAHAAKPIPAKDSKARSPEEKAEAKATRKAPKVTTDETIAVAAV
jgi:hypothetical protein